MSDENTTVEPTVAQVSPQESRIVQLLIERARLKDADLQRARRVHDENPEGSLLALLTRLGLAGEREVAEASAEVLQIPLLAAKDCPEVPPSGTQLSLRFLKHFHVVPIAEDKQSISLLVADPNDPYPVQAARMASGKAVQVRIGLRSEIDDLIERYYGQGRSAMGSIVESLSDDNSRSEDDIEHLRDLASEAPVIRLVNLVIQRAVEQRASDIHIEPFESRLKVRYRIDGVLH
ncbi:MAG: type II secretion system protein GspE, partial [Xanthomonadales bacterium]|nr:type II secretion system protein GspE [Xanthomonadales bacterium]